MILIESVSLGITKEVTLEIGDITDKENIAIIIRDKVSLKNQMCHFDTNSSPFK